MTANINKRSKGLNLQEIWDKYGINIIPPIVAVFIFCVIWQMFSTESFPGPLKVIEDSFTERDGIRLIDPFFIKGQNKGLFWQVLASLQRVAIGYSLAAIVGVSVGIITGVSVTMNRALDPIFQFLRTVPPLAWVPLSLAALRQNEPAALFVIFITAVWPILINTAVGVQQIPQDYNNVAKVLKLSKQKYFFKILLPAALPYIFTGLRIAVGLSWLAIIAAEIVMSGVTGIGLFIWDAYQNNYVSEIIIALLYIGGVGFTLDRLIGFISTLIVPEEQK
jgi:bicarbonate transport system permease protein